MGQQSGMTARPTLSWPAYKRLALFTLRGIVGRGTEALHLTRWPCAAFVVAVVDVDGGGGVGVGVSNGFIKRRLN